MSVEYKEGAKCILKHCYNLHEDMDRCKRRFVRCTLLCPNTNGIGRIFSRTNGPAHNLFECSNEPKNCGCMHAEIKVLQDLIASVHSPLFQYILLCSFSPCTQCTNAIIHSKMIDAVIYDWIYEHDTRGEQRLAQVMPVITVRRIEEIAAGSHRGELCFIKRWGE